MTVSTSVVVALALVVGLVAEEVILTVNVKKPLTVTSEKFLSITLDPTSILTGDLITNNPDRSINMAKALSPAFVRIAGPRSNSYTFSRANALQDEDPGFTFTEDNWTVLNRWAESSGLDVVAAVAPQQHSDATGAATKDAVWDSRNVLDLISFSDHMGFNVSWQLGYECQTRCDISGGDLGKDVMRLRSMLEAFPRYARSIIAGPDVVTFKTKLQQIYLQEYLAAGIGGLSAVTWHPDFASITVDPVGVSMHHDNLALDRDALYRIIGRHTAKKPLWLAESKAEECKKQFLGALVWTRRLGNSAKLGAQVLMRQPQDSNLFEPTPDYWVSVLYKNLVGREVLDTKIAMGNRTHIHFYCQCTRPSSKYERGSLTVFGINLTPAKLSVSLKGLKIKTLHKYILLPGFDAENRMFSETVLLNNEPLKLENGKDLPEMNPAVATSGKGLSMKLPSGGIGFWVLPDIKVKACEGHEGDGADKMLLKKLSKRLEEAASEEDNDTEEPEGQEIENNSEERRPLTKVSKKRRRKGRYSEEDEVVRYKKLDARRDLERLEKLLKWRENLEEKRTMTLRGKPAHIGFEDKSYEFSSDNESGEEIRAKLQFYKRRLSEYEAKKRNSLKSRDKQSATESDALDREKIEEAMSLITKLENAMRSYEVDTSDALNPGNDVSAGLNATKAEEHFLDELLKTRKIKRTVPERIEEQLRAIYEMLAEEKKRRQRLNEDKVDDTKSEKGGETLSRARRDVDKKFGDDPLGLRKDSFFTRRRNRNEDHRERRFGKNRKKDDKRDNGPVIIDPRNPPTDSNENNFYGFAKREPIKGWPQGDVHVLTGTSSEEKKNDYDYVGDDEYMPDQGRRKKSEITSAPEVEEPWVEEGNSDVGQLPKEFLENVQLSSPKIEKHLQEYGELFEAESLADAPEERTNGDDNERILQQKPIDEKKDREAKESVVKQLMGYYENPRFSRTEEDQTTEAELLRVERPTPVQKHRLSQQRKSQEPAQRKRGRTFSQAEDYGSMTFRRPIAASAEVDAPSRFTPESPSKSRPRRNVDLNTILDEEMVFEDDNNLRDCQCRVIRGVKTRECKVCKRLAERREQAQAKKAARRGKRLNERMRTRRDTEGDEEYDYEDEPMLSAEYHDDVHQEATRLDRDTSVQPEPTTSPPPTVLTTIPTTTEKPKLFRSAKNLNKTAAASEKTAKSSSNVPKLPENVSTAIVEDKQTPTVGASVPETKPTEVGTTTVPEAVKVESGAGATTPGATAKTGGSETDPSEVANGDKSTAELPQDSTTTESTKKTKPTRAVLRGVKRPTPKVKAATKTTDSAKSREARLIAKSESLLTAKKETESKRARKASSDSTKILATETAKLQELHKKRLEQLEKLKEKLRTKRTKLQESILLDDLGKFSDDGAKTVKRREIMQLLKEEEELQNLVDRGRWEYVMLYKPANYAAAARTSEEPDESRYVEVVRPLQEIRQKKTPSPPLYYQRSHPVSMSEETVYKTQEPEIPPPCNDATADASENPKLQHARRIPRTEDRQLGEAGEGAPEAESRMRLASDETHEKQSKREKQSKFICMKENSSESSPEDINTPFKLVKSEDYYVGMPLDEAKDKKKSYDEKSKYRSPKYERLAQKKSDKPTRRETQRDEEQLESFNLEEALNSSAYELMMLIPLKQKRRERRDVTNEIERDDAENDIWGNAIEMKHIERKRLGDDEMQLYSMEEIRSAVPEAPKIVSTTEIDGISSLVEGAIPKIGTVVAKEIGKAQNITGSIEKLLNDFEETGNEMKGLDEKTQFELAAKNNPDGLLTHDFFHETIQNVKKFFSFLSGISHVFFAN